MQSLYSSYFSPLSNPKLTIVASSYQIETRISFKKWLDTRIIEKNSSWILQIRNDNALFRIESRKERGSIGQFERKRLFSHSFFFLWKNSNVSI